MGADRWQRAQLLFDSAIELEPRLRAPYLEKACADDGELRREVMSLLARAEVEGDPLGEAVDRAAAVTLETATPALEPGRRLGRYTILEKAGAGGMGEVYVAEDRELRRQVALKLLSGWISRDAERLRRFQREARVLASLSHPGIVTIYSVEHEDGLHFLTMELVRGTSLDRVVTLEGLELERFFTVAVPLVRALAAAHEHGVTHRDLKPANVMLSEAGEVKVLDFGLAKLRFEAGDPAQSTGATAPVTRTGVVLGTVPYMSPEQARGEPQDSRSDIFSLGVVLYEMATGKRPFRGRSSAEVISSILKEKPPSVSEIGRRLPPRLGQIIERCLEKEPDSRYPDAATLGRELSELAEAVRHHPKITRGMARLLALVPRRRGSKLVLVAASLIVLVAIAVGLDLRSLERLRGPPPAPKIVSLAVLPLDNLTGDERQEYLADGMTEVLITELSKIGALKVISRTSVMRFKDSARPLAEIAGELDVDAVVEGSVRRAGDRVGVTAKLIHAASGEPLWADSFERNLRDLLALQGEVARSIALQVEVTLKPEEWERMARADPVDPRAAEAYFQGLHHWNRFSFGEAAEAFQSAIELDPDFARAYAGLAHARQMQGITPGAFPPKRAFSLAKAAVARALELDEELAEAHAVQGWTALHFDWDWEVAERELGRALELDPGHANAHSGWSFYLAIMGRFEEALAAAQRARDLDPLAPMATVMVSLMHYFARDYEGATRELFENWDVGSVPHTWMSSRLAEAKGDAENGAWSAFRMAQVMQLPKPLLDPLEQALVTEGSSGYWREVLKLHLSDPVEFVPAKLVAETLVRLGEADEALAWLERSYERRDSLADLGIDPIWDPLRPDRRFSDLLIRLRLPQAIDGEVRD